MARVGSRAVRERPPLRGKCTAANIHRLSATHFNMQLATCNQPRGGESTGVGTRQCQTLARQSGQHGGSLRLNRILPEAPPPDLPALPEAPSEPESLGLTPTMALSSKPDPACLPAAERRSKWLWWVIPGSWSRRAGSRLIAACGQSRLPTG